MNQSSRLPVGLFDSGMGGLTVLKALNHRLPGEDLLYLVGLGGMCGMYLGARCQKHVPATALKCLLAVILLFTALRYLGQAF